jgi:phage terminase large subunit-like protein
VLQLSEGTAVVDFIQSFCRPSKGEQLLELRPWQRDLILDLFALDERGRRKHRQALIGMPRKNGKSTLGAALALYALLLDDHVAPEVYSVAGDRMQAGIVFREAKAMIEADPDLSAKCRVYRNHIEAPETRAVYRVLSADAPRAQGLNPSFVIFDEVHVQPNEDLWHAMTLGMGAREQPMVVGITTAGFDKDSLAGRLYEHGQRVHSGEIEDPAFFFRWWEPADAQADWRDPAVWAEANPAYGDFLHAESFAADVRNTPENQFRRFRLNQWTTTYDAWLPHGVWDEAKDTKRKVRPDEPVVLGFDGAWTGDSVALVGCTVRDPHLFVVGSWEPQGETVDPEAIDTAIHEAFARYDVQEMACDPYMWRREIEKWKAEGLPVVEWPTNALARMVPACTEFYRAVLEQRLTHDGDPRLARHIANAVVKDDRWGRRIVKDSSARKIDLAVAAIVALERADHHKKPKRRAMAVSF